jgi:hypothetical protein
LVSGAEEAGGGFFGLVRNAPNAIPESVFFFILAVTWKKPKLQGIILTATGLILLVGYPIIAGRIALWVVILMEFIFSGPAIVAGVLLWSSQAGRKGAAADIE